VLYLWENIEDRSLQKPIFDMWKGSGAKFSAMHGMWKLGQKCYGNHV